MSKEHKVTVVGVPTGDGECWCLQVTEQEYRKVVGKEKYRQELKFRADERAYIARAEKRPWLLYPGDLIGHEESGHKVQLTIKTRRV